MERTNKMPKVGNKKFSYTAAGKKKAASYAKKVGKVVKSYQSKMGMPPRPSKMSSTMKKKKK